MKNKLLFISCMANIGFGFLVLSSFRNDDHPESGQKYFIAEYTTGKKWDKELDFSQQPHAGAHSRFLSSLRNKGVIELGARYEDKGIIVFTSTDLQAATSLIKSDSAVAHQLFDVNVNEISFFYEGCIASQMVNSESDNVQVNSFTEPEVTGVGGIFFKCKDPVKVKEWYKIHLGFDTDQYGTNFEWREGADSSRYGFTQWSPFSEKTKYFDPSTKDFMINYRVRNLEALVDKLKKQGVTVLDSIESYDYGKFVHILDIENNKIELWEPNDEEYNKVVGGRTK